MIKSAFYSGLLVLVVACQASATMVAPGIVAFASPENDPTGGVAATPPLVTPLVGAAFNATLVSIVIQGDPSNPLGGLTFVYQVTNDAKSIDAIGRATFTGYDAWLTDMSYQNPAAGLAPLLMDRSALGDAVGFSFIGPPLGPNVLPPGATSRPLVVQTNAPAWTIATGNVIDGSVATGPAYAPLPEPSVISLLLIGSLGWLVRRR
jgi:hypothetical protein